MCALLVKKGTASILILLHCRPREKVNRPLTRRRRENSVDCLEKLRTIHENILHAMEITELMVMRERKKRDIYVSAAVHQLYTNPLSQPWTSQGISWPCLSARGATCK